MPANPFYVKQGGDYTKGLSGLTDVIGEMNVKKEKKEAKQAEFDRINKMKQGALAAYQSQDEKVWDEYLIQNPEMAGIMKEVLKKQFPGDSGKAYEQALFNTALDFSQAPQLLETMKTQFEKDGLDQQEIGKLYEYAKKIDEDPEAAKLMIRNDLAGFGGELWKRYQEITKDTDTKDFTLSEGQIRYDSEGNVIAKGKEKDIDPYEGLTADYETYLRANNLKNSPDNYAKFQFKKKTTQEFSPSPLKKLINERQELIDSGVDETDPKIRAYDAKISGTDIDIENMTPEEVDTWGALVALTGKMPSLGRGKQSTKARMAIAKSAARQYLGADDDGIEDEPGKTPSEAALAMLGEQSDTKAIQGSLNFLDKQLSSMGSFVTNLNSQVAKVGELSKELKTFDTRLLNVPLRTLRGRIKGSPLQAKYDMYLTEIESEIGKLATGSTGSVAELSATAQEKWSKIHDKNLSISAMLSLLEETKAAANFRLDSVQGQLDKTRKRMRREGTLPEDTKPSSQKTDEELMKSLGL